MEQQFTSLFTLIIYCERKGQADFFNEIIDTVIEKFPCKIIFIECTPESSANNIEVHTEMIKPSDKSAGIHCEKVNINVQGKCLERVPFLILAHLVPDLPIYLIWGGDPSENNSLLALLRQLTTHLIVDSVYAENMQDFSNTVLRWRDKADGRIVDMNWARLSGWRHVLLQAFDTDKRIEELQNSDLIEIHYNCINSDTPLQCDVQAIYLQAWIATQLKWGFQGKEKERDSLICHYKQKQHEIKVSLTPQKVETFASGALLRFEATSSKSRTSLQRKKEKSSAIIAEISSQETCQLPFTIPLFTMTRGLTFVKQLLFTPISPHYYKMLELLGSEQ